MIVSGNLTRKLLREFLILLVRFFLGLGIKLTLRGRSIQWKKQREVELRSVIL